MACATARDQADLWFHGIWAEVDDFVLFVESCGGVGLGHSLEGRLDQVCGIVDEVFGCGECVSLVEKEKKPDSSYMTLFLTSLPVRDVASRSHATARSMALCLDGMIYVEEK